MASLRSWAELSRELTASIFSGLRVFDTLTKAQLVCSDHRFNLHKMYRIAVDRSFRRTVDIDISSVDPPWSRRRNWAELPREWTRSNWPNLTAGYFGKIS